ncbi:MAG: bifunctional salicylyl-CoA 5-hydroxylase/oxidoreductase [Anaerolineae bacterium]|nr:bifunctional salicylyl-CoA 5-hydroxylase/oxidoreductase [Anaerolineae bacterium]
MRITCLGGGPAGLYFALLMKKQDPNNDITVIERNRPGDTFGWGVVFSDKTMDNLKVADIETHDEILQSFSHWDDIEIHYKGRMVRSGGHGFCGIGRKRLLNILQARCAELGVKLVYETEVLSDTDYDADLIIASDGLNSRIRNKYVDVYKPDIDTRKCRFVWLGTKKKFEAFTFAFVETEYGWFQAHAYKFDADTSTFIVETPEEVWLKAGIDKMSKEDGIAFCERLFADYLDGNTLISNASHLRGSASWIKFPRIICQNWVHHNGRAPVVLMGDAAHTAHFSIGSGTKLALEDAIELARQIERVFETQPAGTSNLSEGLKLALDHYQAIRQVDVLKIQNAARNSTEWFENVALHTGLETEQFAYSLLTRSQRISHENLRERDAAYVGQMEAWLAQRCGLPAKAVPPMFTPFTLRGLTLQNRVVMSPMAQYSCADGTPDDYYLVHLGSRAHGGAGLIFTEMTCVSPDARITPGCAGMYAPEHIPAWKRIVNYVHRHSQSKIALQLGHAGPKGSTQVGWAQADEPLPSGNWPLLAASAIAYGPNNQVPRAMTRADMDAVKADFVRAAAWARECGFDWLELHCAHGYLLASFLSPLTNKRKDEYGGTVANRCRYPLEVFAAMRVAWGDDKPMSVRISAHDWAVGGNTPDEAVVIAQMFKAVGCDLIDVSSGQTTRASKPVYGRMYQTPFADRIRNEVDIATMAVGAIFEPDHVNSIIAAGRADLCAIARPHLADPYWTLHAAAQLGYTGEAGLDWPLQYLSGRDQLYRNLARAKVVEKAEANG